MSGKRQHPATVTTTWELWDYDVCGNARDGYEVNDRFGCRAAQLELPVTVYNQGTEREFLAASPTDAQIRRLFGCKCRIATHGDDAHVYVTRRRDGYPIGEMPCTSHASLSPIREGQPDERVL